MGIDMMQIMPTYGPYCMVFVFSLRINKFSFLSFCFIDIVFKHQINEQHF